MKMRQFIFALVALALAACGGGAMLEARSDAGADQHVLVASTVVLQGTVGSNSSVGDTVTGRWSFISKPAGSMATLNNPDSVSNATFTADVAGTYRLQLTATVRDSVHHASAVSIHATLGAVAPVAHAGADQSVKAGTQVTLDGSASSDANGDPLTARWMFTSQPQNSQAILTSPTSLHPTFVADVAGTYALSLVVNDGALDSAIATVTVTAALGNVAPVAHAGQNQTVPRNSPVTLDGSGSSDANGDLLTYAWTLDSKPQVSLATLNSPTDVHPTINVDVSGDYTFSLVVSDGVLRSAPSTVTVTVTQECINCG